MSRVTTQLLKKVNPLFWHLGFLFRDSEVGLFEPRLSFIL